MAEAFASGCLPITFFTKPLSDSITSNSADLNVKIYLHNWIRNEVVLKHGAVRLAPEDIDFSVELKEYENSLLRYKIEAKYISITTLWSCAALRMYSFLASSVCKL